MARVYFACPYRGAILAGVLSCIAHACSASPNSAGKTNSRNAAGADSDGGIDASSKPLPSGQAGGPNISGLPPESDAGLSADGACVADAREGKPAAVDIYLLVDKSGSMLMQGWPFDENGIVTGPGFIPWEGVDKALKAFIHSPDNAGLGVGLGFFPVPRAGKPAAGQVCLMNCSQENCDCIKKCGCVNCLQSPGSSTFACYDENPSACAAADYKPAVQIAELPAIANTLTTALDTTDFFEATPTVPALESAYSYTREWGTAHPERKVVVVLATDGDPYMCEESNNIDRAAELASNAFRGSPSIPTYVLGIGNLPNLDKIAAAGGTKAAFLADTNQDIAKQLSTALTGIRTQVFTCNYQIPLPPDGKALDYGLVNVQIALGGLNPKLIGQVPDKAACPADGLAWFYDNPEKPKVISLCPNICNPMENTPNSRLEVLIGCATEIAVVR